MPRVGQKRSSSVLSGGCPGPSGCMGVAVYHWRNSADASIVESWAQAMCVRSCESSVVHRSRAAVGLGSERMLAPGPDLRAPPVERPLPPDHRVLRGPPAVHPIPPATRAPVSPMILTPIGPVAVEIPLLAMPKASSSRFSVSRSRIAAKMAAVSWCRSSRWRKRRMVVSSGTTSSPSSTPTNRRIDSLSYSSSSTWGSERLNHYRRSAAFSPVPAAGGPVRPSGSRARSGPAAAAMGSPDHFGQKTLVPGDLPLLLHANDPNVRCFAMIELDPVRDASNP